MADEDTHPTPTPSNPPDTSRDLTSLSPRELIARINELESRLKSTTAQLAALTTDTAPIPAPSKPKKAAKPFDFSRYRTRLIALKFAYLGRRYSGFEHTNGGVVRLKPTIEEALWKALRRTRLIPPEVPEGCDGSFEVVFDEKDRKKLYWDGKVKLEIDWAGLGYSKCGRTDRGVSAFGQVVGVRVRSNMPKDYGGEGATEQRDEFDHVTDELQYLTILNGVLPPDIRILAWCPNPDPAFDARFSCKERRYKYFFTNPAFCPTPGPLGLTLANGQKGPVREGWLDIEAMRTAAKKLEGGHDFRNFCKIDAGKQMTSCERRITFSDIEEMTAGIDLNQLTIQSDLNQKGVDCGHLRSDSDLSIRGPKVYAFAVHGTAFLWHQVRCMVAVLFLVGQGLESPEIVDKLLDIQCNPGKPAYDMADDAPLVLWDCVFPGDDPDDEGGVKWIYAGDEVSIPALAKKGESPHDGKFGIGGVVTDTWTLWHEAKMKETLTAGLLSLALSQGDVTSRCRGGDRIGTNVNRRSQRAFVGGNSPRNVGDYIDLMQKPKIDPLEVLNAKYLAGKQARRDLKQAEALNDE